MSLSPLPSLPSHNLSITNLSYSIISTGPFVPAIFAVFTIATGQYVLNTWALNNEKCGYPIDAFVSMALVVCYFFLLVYSWVWLGFTYKVTLPTSKDPYHIIWQFSSMFWVAYAYGILALVSFIVWIIGASILNLGVFCKDTAPRLYAFAVYLNTVYWLGFAIVGAVVVNKIFGDRIKEFLLDAMEEPDQNEMEEKIFRQLFNKYDKEKTGKIDSSNISTFVTEIGIYVPEEDMPGLITSLDTKGDGKITYNKLQAWYKKVSSKADDLPADSEDDKKKRKGKK